MSNSKRTKFVRDKDLDILWILIFLSLLLLSISFHLQDYHVFFMHCLGPNRCLVYDLDTTLPFPTYFHKYVTETFRSDLALRPEHHRYVTIRLIIIIMSTFQLALSYDEHSACVLLDPYSSSSSWEMDDSGRNLQNQILPSHLYSLQ